ncbi:MAG: hypothetical protein C5B48_12005 [Candidatus Rokuibacteriota bacterium]|nr:MAG: hypothetical protein C5B48_12005 [Candidatus Rokubacteria bacterium]
MWLSLFPDDLLISPLTSRVGRAPEIRESITRLFGLRRKIETFGLDIGSSSIKAVQLARRRTGYVLKAVGVVPLARGAVSEGTIRKPAAVAEAIKECIRKAGITGTTAVLSVSGRDSIVKRVQLPKATPNELADAIFLEAEHHIPFAIDDVFLDYQVVGETSNSMSVLLVATKRLKVLEYVAAVEDAGFKAALVDLDTFAMQNQFEVNNPHSDREAVALIDIGASVMKTNVVRAGDSIFARDVPFGGNNYTDAIAQRLEIATDTAEAAKHGQEAGVNWDDVMPALEAVSRELALELQRTFDYFASAAESERIAKIVLSGGCARLAGIEHFLASSFGVPVELARPFQGIECDSEQFSDANVRDNGSLFAVAVGLGLRAPRDKTR